ncbi:MAG: site-2 protease family protein [Oscillospiraceae bacterium]
MLNYIPYVIAAVICLSIHELSHGVAAYLFGDDTAKSEGRISLNPLRHIDPVGFLMLVIFHFGWAKPVHVDMRRFRNPKLGMAATAFAGPLSNFLLAALLMPVFGIIAAVGTSWSDTAYNYTLQFLAITMRLSVSLGVFNLFPIPPLDGSKVVEAVLPEQTYYQIMRYERIGMIVLLVAVWSGILDTPLLAVTNWVYNNLLYLAQWSYDLANMIF